MSAPNVLFFEEPVGALDGVIELAWVDVEVGNGVEVAVGDIHGSDIGTCGSVNLL